MSRHSSPAPSLSTAQRLRTPLRVVLLVLAAGCALWMVTQAAIFVVSPVIVSARLATGNDALRRQVAAKEREKQALAEQVARWKSPEGAAALARRRGYMKAGERGVIIVDASATAPHPTPATAPPPVAPNPMLMLLGGGLLLTALLAAGVAVILRRRTPRIVPPTGQLTPRSTLRRRQHTGFTGQTPVRR